MEKKIGKYTVKLTNTLITVYINGNLVKAKDTHPLHSVDKFNALVNRLKTL